MSTDPGSDQPPEVAATRAGAAAEGAGRFAALSATRSRVFVRNFAAEELLELFLVMGVSAVLLIRFLLGLSGYPQLGGAGLHIAHLLWGGMLMVGALFLLLVYLGQRVMRLAAIIGGLGFGVFLDELGKFITSDNNYFYKPTIALIYLIFVALFLVVRAVQRQRVWSQETYLINALMLLQEAVLHDLDTVEHRHATALLRQSKEPQSLAAPLGALLAALPAVNRPRTSMPSRMLRLARQRAHRALSSRWLPRLVSVVFCVRVLVFVLATILLAVGLAISGTRPTPTEIIAFAAAFISNSIGIVGVVSLLRSRLAAFLWFKRSVIVSIFLADVFAFYQEQLTALSSLTVDVVLFVVLNALLRHELARSQTEPADH
ncbi:MAG: hypothetical protein DLM67_15380 [Candidatus Nephthysia bennettiae]|uniref:DUF2157 domain-containing protein n=1 Tax=Candidatus Nephthysia bennettiae TaxID=3127016 RepID=A0A934N8K0_9BACT|nr:hypothetical protein [Candidatus Dormibacteraeota bacterium]PZR92099.1 MAG: hypothetical protein DLM67_15380 [Candidatus Dormibacteraeota bacterium]